MSNLKEISEELLNASVKLEMVAQDKEFAELSFHLEKMAWDMYSQANDLKELTSILGGTYEIR